MERKVQNSTTSQNTASPETVRMETNLNPMPESNVKDVKLMPKVEKAQNTSVTSVIQEVPKTFGVETNQNNLHQKGSRLGQVSFRLAKRRKWDQRHQVFEKTETLSQNFTKIANHTGSNVERDQNAQPGSLHFSRPQHLCRVPCELCISTIPDLEAKLYLLQQHLRHQKEMVMIISHGQPNLFNAVVQKELLGRIQMDVHFLKQHIYYKRKSDIEELEVAISKSTLEGEKVPLQQALNALQLRLNFMWFS